VYICGDFISRPEQACSITLRTFRSIDQREMRKSEPTMLDDGARTRKLSVENWRGILF
jgi:hypothetical protein